MVQYRARGISRRTGKEVWLVNGWRNKPEDANEDLNKYSYLDLYTNIWIEIGWDREKHQRPTLYHFPHPSIYYHVKFSKHAVY